MATEIISRYGKRKGQKITLYDPSERGAMYAMELAEKKRYKDGAPLTASQAGYRMGYLNARKESAKIFKKKNPGYVRKTR